jgi:tetratricopeptide (TPR) repeat protein
MRELGSVLVAATLAWCWLPSAAADQVKKAKKATPPSPTLAAALKAYEGNDFHTASRELYHVVDGATNDSVENTQRAEFWLGKALYHLHLYTAALRCFTRVAHKATAHAYHDASLKWLLALENKLPGAGASGELKRYDRAALKQPALEPVKDEALHRLALAEAQSGNDKLAVELLQAVSTTSAFGARARLLLGVVQARAQRRAEAATTLRAALALAERAPTRPESTQTKGGALLALARLHLLAGEHDACLQRYAELPAGSPFVLEGMLHGAWAQLQRRDPAKALEALHRLHTPHFAHYYFPEGLVLRAAIHAQRGQPERAEEALQSFRGRFPAFAAYLEATLRTYTNSPDLYDELLKIQRRTVSAAKETVRMVETVLEDPDLQERIGLIDETNRELALVRAAPAAWKATAIAGGVLQELVLQKSLRVHNAGTAARHRMSMLGARLSALAKQADMLGATLRACREARRAPTLSLAYRPEALRLFVPSPTARDALGTFEVKVLAGCR